MTDVFVPPTEVSHRAVRRLSKSDDRRYKRLLAKLGAHRQYIKTLDMTNVSVEIQLVAKEAAELALHHADTAYRQWMPFNQFKHRVKTGELALTAHVVQTVAGAAIPDDIVCSAGCAMCCVYNDVVAVSKAEIEAVLRSMEANPANDAAAYHKNACKALDPDTKQCRAYHARPGVCRRHASISVQNCDDAMNTTDPAHKAYMATNYAHVTVESANVLLLAALGTTTMTQVYNLKRVLHLISEGYTKERAMRQSRVDTSEAALELQMLKDLLTRAEKSVEVRFI